MLGNLGSGIYGLTTVGALPSAESAGSETYAESVLAVGLSMLAIWLAKSYGELTEWRMREAQSLSRTALLASLRAELPVLIGGALPLLAVVIAWVAGTSLNTGVNAGSGRQAGRFSVSS